MALTKPDMPTTIEDMVEEVNGRPNAMHTINSAVFSSTRLLTLQTRLSAAYKGIIGSSLQGEVS